jgi:hypothetical protein
MSPGMQGSVPGAQARCIVYTRGGHEWPPFLFVAILTSVPVLFATEMTWQKLFLAVTSWTKLAKSILMKSARRKMKRSRFCREVLA